jgi:hypothetical protein
MASRSMGNSALIDSTVSPLDYKRQADSHLDYVSPWIHRLFGGGGDEKNWSFVECILE